MDDINNISIIMAMQSEASPIIDQLNLKLDKNFKNNLPIKIYNNIIDNKKISLVYNGISNKYKADRVGTQAAALSAYICSNYLKPDLIISMGTAGADKKNSNINIGDIIIGSDYYFYHDRRIPLDKFEQYGLGFYSVYNQAKYISKRLNFESYIISTGDSLTSTVEDLTILKKYKAKVKEMEVASIAEVASYYNIPVLAIKAITDYYNNPETSTQEFINNFNLAISNLSKNIKLIVNAIN